MRVDQIDLRDNDMFGRPTVAVDYEDGSREVTYHSRPLRLRERGLCAVCEIIVTGEAKQPPKGRGVVCEEDEGSGRFYLCGDCASAAGFSLPLQWSPEEMTQA